MTNVPGQSCESCSCNKTRKCKAYSVLIEIEIQRVTCPGVWLCNNGKVTMQIFLLGLCTQTSSMNPNFPLACHEKFIFRKNFANIQNLVDIDRKLDKEIIYMELVQWEDCSNGNVLATFKTTLNDLLYPFPCYKGVVAGVDVDLLMEATRIFPGIIAPKIEISTKLTIEEVLCSVKQEKQNDLLVINPKLISSKCAPRRAVPAHQRKVCHNTKYHISKQAPPPKFCTKKRCVKSTTSSNPKTCTCAEEKLFPASPSPPPPPPPQYSPKKMTSRTSPAVRIEIPKCICSSANVACALCKKYKNYFNDCGCDNNATEVINKPRDEDQATVTQFKLCKCNNPSKVKTTNSSRGSDREKSQKFRESAKEEINLCCCDDIVKQECCCSSKGSKVEQEFKPESKRSSRKGSTCKVPRPSTSNPTCLTPAKSLTCNKSTCNEIFYRNLENFYKQLYLRAHNKLKNELCKCDKH